MMILNQYSMYVLQFDLKSIFPKQFNAARNQTKLWFCRLKTPLAVPLLRHLEPKLCVLSEEFKTILEIQNKRFLKHELVQLYAAIFTFFK
jgi:hypothetical protein